MLVFGLYLTEMSACSSSVPQSFGWCGESQETDRKDAGVWNVPQLRLLWHTDLLTLLVPLWLFQREKSINDKSSGTWASWSMRLHIYITNWCITLMPFSLFLCISGQNDQIWCQKLPGENLWSPCWSSAYQDTVWWVPSLQHTHFLISSHMHTLIYTPVFK